MIWAAAPAYLWWLPAAAVPVLLFFLRRRRLRIFPFPPARLLAEAALVRTRMLKLMEALLLLIRVALVVLAVLSLARPMLQPRGFLASLLRPETSAAEAFIDASPSMSRPSRKAGLSLLDLAEETARSLREAGLVSGIRRFSPSDAGGGGLAGVSGDGTPVPVLLFFTDGAADGADLFPLPEGLKKIIVVPLEPAEGPDAGIESARSDEPFPLRGASVGIEADLVLSAPAEVRLSVLERNGDGGAVIASSTRSLPKGRSRVSLEIPPSFASPGLYTLRVESPGDAYSFNDELALAVNRFPPRRIVLSAESEACARALLAPTGKPELDGTVPETVPMQVLHPMLEQEAASGDAPFIAVFSSLPPPPPEGGWLGICSDGFRVLLWSSTPPPGMGKAALAAGEVVLDDGVRLGGVRGGVVSSLPPGAVPLLSLDIPDGPKPAAFLLRSGRGAFVWCGLDAAETASKPWGPALCSFLLDAASSFPPGVAVLGWRDELPLPASPAGALLHLPGGGETPVFGDAFRAAGWKEGLYEVSGLRGRLDRFAFTITGDRKERFPPASSREGTAALARLLERMAGVPVSVVPPGDGLMKETASAMGVRSLQGFLALIFFCLLAAETLLANHLSSFRSAGEAPGSERMAV